MKRRKIAKYIWAVLGILLALVLTYGACQMLAYQRIEDFQDLEPRSVNGPDLAWAVAEKPYSITTWNLSAPQKTMEEAASLAASWDSDFLLQQQVNLDFSGNDGQGGNSCFQNQLDRFVEALAICEHSTDPGYPWRPASEKRLAGISTYSRFSIGQSTRRSLPVKESWDAFSGTDPCYTVTRITIDEQKPLWIYNIDLEPEAVNSEKRLEQVKQVLADMEEQYKKGDYVICGGDFGADLKALLAEEISHTEISPMERGLIPRGFSLALDCLGEAEAETFPATFGSASSEQTAITDGFLVSDNIIVHGLSVLETEFNYSDHNPVQLEFELIPGF